MASLAPHEGRAHAAPEGGGETVFSKTQSYLAPLSAASAEDWEATANRASRDTAASIRDIESFRRRLDDAKRAVDALANSRVSLRELESMSAELGERNAEHERELEEVARLNGISLTREEEPRAR